MPLGDSITWGVGSSTGNGYRGPLWNKLAADGHPLDFVGTGRGGSMSDPDNEGHSGYRIDQIAALADASLTRYRPNVVTLEIGTNDLNGSYQVSTATDRLKSLVDQITADVPDATVLVASLVVSTSGTEEQYRAAYNQAIPQIVSEAQAAGKHVGYVDMSSLTTADLADALHPNDAGYQKMADAFHRGIQAADSAGWLRNPAPAPARVQSDIARQVPGRQRRRHRRRDRRPDLELRRQRQPVLVRLHRRHPALHGQVPRRHRLRHGQRHQGADLGLQRRLQPGLAALQRRLPQPRLRPLPRRSRASPRPTARSSTCGTATAAPTRSGPL